jgi:two-component system, chemotaxis family, protein-glutamate methylesterase/glutaminase
MIPGKKIRVLIVDDSAVVRQAISRILSRDPDIEVVGTASDPYVARDKILELSPDVLTLDVEMPRMDGITFLRILQQHRPLPVIIISSITQTGSRAALEALSAGAVDVIPKTSSAWSVGDFAQQLPDRIKVAARAQLNNCRPAAAATDSRLTHSSTACVFDRRQVLVLGASTGGTEALRSVLTRLPDGLPGICIVQHIPPVFSKAFAERLNACCAFEVREAAHGDEVRPGLALIAPGDYHMVMSWEGDRYRVRLNQAPPVHHTRPSVDILFESAAACAGPYAVSALLTGMGSDGAIGMQKLKARGASTIAQDERTCVVYGMPRAAVELGVVDTIAPLDQIPQAILKAIQRRGSSSPRPAAPPLTAVPHSHPSPT